MSHIEIYTDGSATTADKPGGWAYVIVIDGEKYSEDSGYIDKASNNDAELEAVIQGLISVNRLKNLNTELEKIQQVTIVSDSQLILGWITGEYAFRQFHKMDKFKQLKLLVITLDAKTRWVEGHSGVEFNERCDKLANYARLQMQNKANKIEAIIDNKTLIGTKKTGTVCLWYKNSLKIVDLDQGIVEEYNREIHGNRGSLLEIREEKSR